jgi:hypothetical protein
MGRVSSYRFHHVWHLDAAAARVFGVLADVERYAVWWPQVRRIERIDEDSGRAMIRSFLPYTLDLVLRRETENPDTGVLRVGVSGDLEGWCQWQVEPGDSARAVFDQVAVVTPRLLARTSPVSAPLLRANHAWMMRGGRLGLAAYLRAG